MRIKVYGGYYELYITDKEMPGNWFGLMAEFETVWEAIEYVDEKEDWLFLDSDLIEESGYCWDGDDYENHIFDYNEKIAKLKAIEESWKQ